MTLATQADVEKLLQVDFGADPDASVAQYLAQADAMIASYCGQKLTWESGIVDTWSAESNEPVRVLSRFPITAVTSVVEDDVTLTVDDEYVWSAKNGTIRRVSGSFDWVWSTYVNANVVTFSAGYGTGAPSPYDDVPDDLVLVAAGLAASLFRHGAAWAAHGVDGPVKSIALDGSDTITYDTSQANAESSNASAPTLTEGQKMLLAPYRRRLL